MIAVRAVVKIVMIVGVVGAVVVVVMVVMSRPRRVTCVLLGHQRRPVSLVEATAVGSAAAPFRWT